MLRASLIACVLASPLVLFSSPLAAEDRATLIPEGGTDPVIIIGTVEDFSGSELVIRRKGSDGSDHFTADRVLTVQTWHTTAHDQGAKELREGKTALAEQTLLKAVRDETRDWVQRDILALLVQCVLRRADWGTAGSRFLEIARHDPLTRHWSVAPLVWAPQTFSEADKDLARGWLSATGLPERLLGASWLLFDPELGDSAEKKFLELTRESNSVVSSLARSQLWRLRMVPDLSDVEVAKWRSEVRRLPRSIRSGPQYLLGRGLMTRREYAAAASELLWIPTVYHENEVLSARSLSDAGLSLTKTGKVREALVAYDELISRFPWSPWASEARDARSVLSHSNGSGENTPPER